MSFKISQTDSFEIEISAGKSDVSEPSEAKFGFNRGSEDQNSFNTVCIGNFTNTLHPTPEITETPELREITTTAVTNSICAAKFIVMFAQTTILNGHVVSAAVDSNGNITCIPCRAGTEERAASQVLGVALEAATAGNPVNVAVSGFCNAIGDIPAGNGIALPGSSGIITENTTAGFVQGNQPQNSNVSTCGMVIKATTATTVARTADWNYLIRIMPGHEAF